MQVHEVQVNTEWEKHSKKMSMLFFFKSQDLAKRIKKKKKYKDTNFYSLM